MKKVVIVLAAALGLVVGAIALTGKTQASFCNDPLGDQTLCLQMKALASHVELLDAQRDLMVVDYDYLGGVTGAMANLVNIITGTGPRSHDEALAHVKAAALQAHQEALNSDPASLRTANAIRGECLACHANANPTSGVKWSQIATNSWDSVIPLCNDGTRNPYLCKNMHGMLTTVGYYLKSYQAGLRDFVALANVARETGRIANDLISKNITHGDAVFLHDVQTSAADLEKLARAEDPAAYGKAFGIAQSCSKCHAVVR